MHLLATTLNISVAHSPLDTISIKWLQMTKWEIKLLTNQSKNIARIVEVGNNSSMIVNEGGGLVKASAFDYFNNWGWRTLGL